MDQKHIVYLATNIANGKRYVGYTSVGLEKRRQRHHVHAFGVEKRGTRLHAALRKYGRDAFVWEVLAVFTRRSEALAEEIGQISKLRPEYNVTSGGEGTLGNPAWNRKPVTCLTDGKMFVSAIAAGRHYGLGQVAVSEICSGKYRSAGNALHFVWGDVEYGIADRVRLIREIEDAHAYRRKRVKKNNHYYGVRDGKDTKGRSAAGPAKLAKRVVCLEDSKEYASASEVARVYNIARSSIIELCLGKNGRQTVGGHRFKYVEA